MFDKSIFISIFIIIYDKWFANVADREYRSGIRQVTSERKNHEEFT